MTTEKSRQKVQFIILRLILYLFMFSQLKTKPPPKQKKLMLITQIISPQIVYSETIHFISGVPLYGRYNRKQRPQKKGLEDKGDSTCLHHFLVKPDVKSTSRSITKGTTPSGLSRVDFHVVIIIKALHH